MKDLIIGVLNEIPETHIIALGINRGNIISLGNANDYYQFGANLAKLDIWSDCFKKPCLLDIIIEDQEGTLEEGVRRRIQIKSADVHEIQYGIDVNINNHYTSKKQDVGFAISTLDSYLQSDIDRYETILSLIVKRMNNDA